MNTKTTEALIEDYKNEAELCGHVEGYTISSLRMSMWRLYKRLFLDNDAQSWDCHRNNTYYVDAYQGLCLASGSKQWLCALKDPRTAHAATNMVEALIDMEG